MKFIKKLIIILSLITFTKFSYSFGPDPIFDEKLSDFKRAYGDLKSLMPELEIRTDHSYDSRGNKHTSYSYRSTNNKAIIALWGYFNRYTKLTLNLYKNAFGDGFILGIFAALTNKLLSNEKNETNIHKALIPLITSIGVTCYDNQKIGLVPFFDGGALSESDNLFSNTNIHSFGRTGLTTLSLIFSYLATHSVLDKLGYYLSKEEDVENPEKTVDNTNNNSKSNLLKKFKNYFKDYANNRKDALNKIDKKKALKIFGTTAITLTTLALIKMLIKKLKHSSIKTAPSSKISTEESINYLPTARLKTEEIIEEDYTNKVWPLEVD